MFTGMCPCNSSPADDTMGKLAVQALAEFMGTFFLVHAIVFSVNFGEALAALAIGSTLMVCIYAWGHVSGAHYNPAVSTACWVAGKIGALQWGVYVLTQLIAGIVSAFIAVSLCENRSSVDDFAVISFDGDEGLYTELVWTFLLASVVLNTAASCAPAYRNNSFFGLAIGFTVVAGAISVGGFSGGAFNPAVATGLNVGNTQIDNYNFNFSDWIKAVTFEFLGGILAGVTFMITESVEKPDDAENKGTVEAL